MKKQKPETLLEGWDVNDKIYSVEYRRRAKRIINRAVRRIFKKKIFSNPEEA